MNGLPDDPDFWGGAALLLCGLVVLGILSYMVATSLPW